VSGHVETVVKVNVWVDEGVAPLVEALSTWSDVVTVDSCEAGSDALAYVQFTAQPPESVVAVAEQIAYQLSSFEECPATLSIEWAYGGELPLAKLSCPTHDVARLSAQLISACRRTASSRDTTCTSTRS